MIDYKENELINPTSPFSPQSFYKQILIIIPLNWKIFDKLKLNTKIN